MKQQIKRVILTIAQRIQLIQRIARVITYHSSDAEDTYGYLRERFINNGKYSQLNETIRSEMVNQFECIDRNVQIASNSTDGLFMAEMALNMQALGSFIECGCYTGGSSAKLSIVAKLLGRELVIFDSFEGLPTVGQYYLRDQHCRRSKKWVTDWKAGRYASRLEEVKSNIRKYGEISVCSFVKGWFSETITNENLPEQIAFVFADVDLANSARDCFITIWPRLTSGGIYVSHDVSYIKVLQEFYNQDLWRNIFKSIPPILFGAGFGLCNDSPHLGYMVKGESLSSEYLKSLTIDK